jgi:uncharacterized protein (TIGR00725 family)
VRTYVGVVGAGEATADVERTAEEVGRLLAIAGATVVCGGLGGVMAGACRGARAAGGTTVGILPGLDAADANEWVDVALPTGMGEMRNVLIVRASDVLVAVAGEYGTLSEIAFALRDGIAVVGLGTWDVRGVDVADGPADAVARAMAHASARPRRR